MTQVDFQEHWLFILRDIVQPIQQKVYTGYYSDVNEFEIEITKTKNLILATESCFKFYRSLYARTTTITSTAS